MSYLEIKSVIPTVVATPIAPPVEQTVEVINNQPRLLGQTSGQIQAIYYPSTNTIEVRFLNPRIQIRANLPATCRRAVINHEYTHYNIYHNLISDPHILKENLKTQPPARAIKNYISLIKHYQQQWEYQDWPNLVKACKIPS